MNGEEGGDEERHLRAQELHEATKALHLRLLDILRTTLDIIVHPAEEDSVIAPDVLLDAVRSAQEAYTDRRNAYKYAISTIKLHAIQAFWITKLKPIRTNRLQKADGTYSINTINEAVALAFLLDGVAQGIKSGGLWEFFGLRTPNSQFMELFLKEYREGPSFFKSDGSSVEGSQMLYETQHNMRYRNLTAVALYEMMMHSIIASRVSARG